MSGYREPSGTSRAPPEKGPYTELRALADTYGVPYAGGTGIEITLDEVQIVVELCIDSGTVRGATFEVTGRTWPSVSLSVEDEEEVEGKRLGMTREYQTGDAVFDARAFIDTQVPDDELETLLDPARRKAILTLLQHSRVSFRQSGICVRIDEPKAFDVTFVETNVLKPLCTLAHAPSLPLRERRPLPGEGLVEPLEKSLVFTLCAVPSALAIAFIWTRQCIVLALIGAVGGGLLSIPARYLLRRMVAGHTQSHTLYFLTKWSLALVMVGWGSLVPILLNALVDAEPRRAVQGVVSETHGVDEDDTHVNVTVRWTDGSEDHVSLPPETKKGARVRGWKRRGWLGWQWEQRGDVKVIDTDSSPSPTR